MRYKAVIFDLDGTLVDSLADLADSVNELLRQYQYPVHQVEEYKRMVGNGARNLIKCALPPGMSDNLIDEALGCYKVIYEQGLLQKTRPYAGIFELLSALQQSGIKLAVCTNKHQAAAEAIINNLFPRGTFAVIAGERDNVPRKPAPDAVLAIAISIGVKPDEIVYIGDSKVDMQTGVNANMLPVGVLWGFSDRKELEENGAMVIIAKPMELLTKVAVVI